MSKYSGKGWHFQHVRHSNARKYGKAGGKYVTTSVFNKKGKQLKIKVPFNKYVSEQFYAKDMPHNVLKMYNMIDSSKGKKKFVKDFLRGKLKTETQVTFKGMETTDLPESWYNNYDHGTNMITGEADIYLPTNKVKQFTQMLKKHHGKIVSIEEYPLFDKYEI